MQHRRWGQWSRRSIPPSCVPDLFLLRGFLPFLVLQCSPCPHPFYELGSTGQVGGGWPCLLACLDPDMGPVASPAALG